MRKLILLTAMQLLTVLGIQARSWEPPSDSQYANHAVVYVTFKDSSANPVGSIGPNTMLGAFINGECRAVTSEKEYTPTGSDTPVYIFTLRIGVSSEDAGKEVHFAIKGANEYDLVETLTVSGGDETVGGTPSKPFGLTFVPVTDLNLKNEVIRIRKGDEVTQYLKHMYTILPEDATVKEDGISYEILTDASNVLRKNDDGTITAISSGEETVVVAHNDVKYTSCNIIVNVVDIPTTDDFKIISNPLTIQLADYELHKVNILDKLNENISVGFSIPEFPSNFVLAETGSDTEKILKIWYSQDSGAATEVVAQNYGSTHVEWTYQEEAAGFDEKGNFQEGKEYTITTGYDLNITQMLSSIDAIGIVIGIDDEDATITIETVPANFILDESLIKWNIPDLEETHSSPILEIGDRIEGKNEWKVKPLALNKDKALSLSYNGIQSDTARVQILQRVNLNEGWHWISLYADMLNKGQITAQLANVQEIRSQYELTYNDPDYGFFGTLGNMNCTQAYKVMIKEGQGINFLLPEITSYTGNGERSIYSGWNWLQNPYCFSHTINEALGKTALPDESRIVSKEGFAVLTEGQWVGTLETLVAGEGYLLYNPEAETRALSFLPESYLTKVDKPKTTSARVRSRAAFAGPWSYENSRFSDNMTIIAKGAKDLDESRYSIGAFVDNECRGEGKIIEGKFFITVHGESGESVSFKIFDEISGEYIALPDRVEFTEMAGTFNMPVKFNTAQITGINDVNTNGKVEIYFDGDNIVIKGLDTDQVEIYTTSGQRVGTTDLPSGIYLVKAITSSGAITRKLIKN